jgi:serine phosphatase RsbU (regulator of sigma subunit)
LMKTLNIRKTRQYKHLSSEELIQSIIDSLKEFQGSVKQEDDITLVVVKVAD